jgi:hypothetical protein
MVLAENRVDAKVPRAFHLHLYMPYAVIPAKAGMTSRILADQSCIIFSMRGTALARPFSAFICLPKEQYQVDLILVRELNLVPRFPHEFMQARTSDEALRWVMFVSVQAAARFVPWASPLLHHL